MIVLDTDVVSGLMRSAPDDRVVTWVDQAELATRNVKDFVDTGVPLHDPWGHP